MLNKVMLIGRLGADPEVRYMTNGSAVTTANIATSRNWKDKQTGERREETEWHRVVFFNQGNYRLAEIAGEHLKKGSQVYVEGRLTTRKWQDKSGKDCYTTEVLAEEMHMIGSKPGGGNVPPVSAYEKDARPVAAQSASSAPASAGGNDFDDDIPF